MNPKRLPRLDWSMFGAYAMGKNRFQLSAEDLARLSHLTSAGSRRTRERARILLLSGLGHSVREIANELGAAISTVYKWQRRYRRSGLEGLEDLPRPGQPRKLSPGQERRLARLLNEELPENRLEWSIRGLAKCANVTEHQARSALSCSRPSAPVFQGAWHAGGVRPLAELASLCIAAPLLGAVFVVEGPSVSSNQRPPPLTLPQTLPPAHYRTDPKSLYRAFDVAGTASSDSPQNPCSLKLAIGHVLRTLPGRQRLCVVVAPGVALDNTSGLDLDQRSLLLPVTAVSFWLKAMEAFLSSLEHAANFPETTFSEVQLLRWHLKRHNQAHASQSGAPFVWHSPKLATSLETRACG